MKIFRAAAFGKPLRALPCAALCLLAGCAVGPNFEKPAAPKINGYVAQPLATTASTPNVIGGEAQRFDIGADLSGDWWTLFHSKQLNALIEQALASNHDLKAAQAALKVAHENTLAQRGGYLPSLSTGFSASREH
ncbi:MAG TPA: TolC family protein, partial [Rhodanobacteraceae bacterium]|nr:TolC family protein [Rhodanobacteraceae bacterium]